MKSHIQILKIKFRSWNKSDKCEKQDLEILVNCKLEVSSEFL